MSTAINADDTLEEIEYVLDLGLNYVPKRLINEIKLKSEAVKQEDKTENIDDAVEKADKKAERESTRNADTSMDNDDEIIMVDSSPENSFTTTRTTERFKSAFESIDNTFYTAKSILNNVSVVSIDSDESDESDEQPSSKQSTQETIEPSQASENEQEKSSTLQKSDISVVDSMEMSTSTQIDNSAMAAANDMEMPNFNDSLERVEYMMEQAQKMMDDRAKTLCVPIQTGAKKTPVSQTKLKPKVLTPNSASLKKCTPKHLTPNKGDFFKRPDQRNVRSPFTGKAASASKVQPPNGQSRIPTKTGSLHKSQFRHIASPIAAYIKNTPEVPLLKTIKPMHNLLTEDFNKACNSNSSLDESTQSVESFPTKTALPRKMYISAQQRKVNFRLF